MDNFRLVAEGLEVLPGLMLVCPGPAIHTAVATVAAVEAAGTLLRVQAGPEGSQEVGPGAAVVEVVVVI